MRLDQISIGNFCIIRIVPKDVMPSVSLQIPVRVHRQKRRAKISIAMNGLKNFQDL